MSIIKLIGKTIVLFVCSVILTIGVLIEGIAKIFGEIANCLEVTYERIFTWKPKQKKKQVDMHVPL